MSRNRTTPDVVACPRCQSFLAPEARVCSCGMASPLMSFVERNAYEVEQYRMWRATRGS